MQVFLCWSGDASKRIAEALYTWLGDVLQELRPFMSSESIRKGDRWRTEIGQQLSETNFGILCLTKSNLSAPWVLFEAGALSKNVKEGRVTALLCGIEPTDVIEPLSQFQQTAATREDLLKLMLTLNSLLPVERRLPAERLERAFSANWPTLEKQLSDALVITKDGKVAPTRSVSDMVSEILVLVRDMRRERDVNSVDSWLDNVARHYWISGERLLTPELKERLAKLGPAEKEKLSDALRKWYQGGLGNPHVRMLWDDRDSSADPPEGRSDTDPKKPFDAGSKS